MIGERVCVQCTEGIMCGTVEREPKDGFVWLNYVINFTRMELSPIEFAVPYWVNNLRVLVS